MDDFFSSLDLDTICSVDLLLKLESKLAPVAEEVKLEAAKTLVAATKSQFISLISNLPQIIEATDFLINSSILDDQKTVLANIKD